MEYIRSLLAVWLLAYLYVGVRLCSYVRKNERIDYISVYRIYHHNAHDRITEFVSMLIFNNFSYVEIIIVIL